MKTIDNWANKKLICSKCGTDKSVKWSNNDNVFCNKCIITDVLKNNQLVLTDEEIFDKV